MKLYDTQDYDDNPEEYDYYPDILTPKEAQEILGIGEALLYRLLNSGKLPGKKLGKKVWRISKKQLIAYMNS